MLKALVNNQIVEPSKGAIGICPESGADVIPVMCEVKVKHWRHKKSSDYDKWHESETEWHRNWKKEFGIEYAEKRLEQNGIWHIADILTKDGVVIEFQNSPISNGEISKRELFYGQNMIWVLNGINFIENFKILEEVDYKDYYSIMPTTIAGRDFLEIYSKDIRKSTLISYITDSGFKYWREEGDRYCKIIDLDSSLEEELSIFKRGLDELYLKHLKEKQFIQYYFEWKRPKRNWESSLREIYIDTGKDELYWIQSKRDLIKNKLIIISKDDFLKKYK